MKNSILAVEDLSFRYAGEPILDHTGFVVRPGDFVGLIGSNGAGKSTLLRLILGELKPQGGRVCIFGQPVEHFSSWSQVGYVPQNSASTAIGFPANALEVVLANLYGDIGRFRLPGRKHRERALAALASVGMQDHARQLIGELSGGQLQRVMLARALVAEPKLLLLDEPTTGVDPETVEALYQMLEEQNRRGVTIIMVTHDLHRAVDYLQRAFCLEHGTIVELDGDQMAHELEHRHRHP